MTDVKKEIFHPAMSDVNVTLKNAPLWKQFYKEGTEMIITKSGRRMFPSLRLSLSGLEEEARYFVVLETALSDGHRYKFSTSEWSVVGTAEPQTHSSTRLYVHPDSPATGASWMSQDVLFHRAKLTNNTLDRSGNLVLTSMHKYQPRIHVIKASDILALHWSPTVTFTFPVTEFIAVTAYQNEKITKLKIDNNPFAKGFRENGQARTKRKLQSLEKIDETKEETFIENDCQSPDEAKKICESTNSHDSDSGVSVGSVTPPPEETSSQQTENNNRIPLPTISISDVPQPTYYNPHTFWPVTPVLFHTLSSYHQSPYHHHHPHHQTYPPLYPPRFPIPLPLSYHHSTESQLIDLSVRK